MTKDKKLDHITTLIEREVSYFNGWHVSDTTARNSCRCAAEKILTYLSRKKKSVKKRLTTLEKNRKRAYDRGETMGA